MIFVRTFVFLLFLVAVRCSPLPEYSDVISNIKNSDETRFPNGTVIGKCTYLDREGDPIHVRYYADKNSYGVELKSIKVSGPSPKRNKMSPDNYLKESDKKTMKNKVNKEYMNLDDLDRESKNHDAHTFFVGGADRILDDHNIAERYAGNKDSDVKKYYAKNKMQIRSKNKRLLRNAGCKRLHDDD